MSKLNGNPGVGHAARILAGSLRWYPKVVNARRPCRRPTPASPRIDSPPTEGPVIYGVFCLQAFRWSRI